MEIGRKFYCDVCHTPLVVLRFWNLSYCPNFRDESHLVFHAIRKEFAKGEGQKELTPPSTILNRKRKSKRETYSIHPVNFLSNSYRK